MSEDKKERRGFQLNIGMEHFSDIIANALNLPVGSIRVHHVADNYTWQAVNLTIEGFDESFPIVTKGCVPPTASLEMEVLIADEGYREVIKGLVKGVFI